jgi:hypothetical protein
VVDEVALEQVFLRDLFCIPLLIIIPTLLHTHLSPPHELCDSPDQVAHYHTSVQVNSFLWPALGWSRSKNASVYTQGNLISDSVRCDKVYSNEFVSAINEHQGTNPILKSPSWEASSRSVCQEIDSFLWDPKVHYRVKESKSPDPDHTFILNCSQINIILTTTLRSPK